MTGAIQNEALERRDREPGKIPPPVVPIVRASDERLHPSGTHAVGVQSPIEIIHRQFGLTTAETMTLVAVVETGGVKEAAAQIGVAPSTVKTHLGSVFDKTGARSQTELVKLVAGLSSPFGEG